MLQFYFSQKLDWTHESLCKDMPLQVGNFYLVLKLLYNSKIVWSKLRHCPVSTAFTCNQREEVYLTAVTSRY
jgi:hypothetical protein